MYRLNLESLQPDKVIALQKTPINQPGPANTPVFPPLCHTDVQWPKRACSCSNIIPKGPKGRNVAGREQIHSGKKIEFRSEEKGIGKRRIVRRQSPNTDENGKVSGHTPCTRRNNTSQNRNHRAEAPDTIPVTQDKCGSAHKLNQVVVRICKRYSMPEQ